VFHCHKWDDQIECKDTALSSSEWSLHLLLWGISDEVSAKRQLRSETQLWTCLLCLEKDEPDLIMSLSALEKKQVHIDCELCSWHFSINLQMLSLKDLNKFEETAERSVTCAFLWAVLKLLTVCLQGTATVSSIPQAYADYADVFSKSEAECLSAHEKHNYVIDNNEKNPSHSSLYNLSDKNFKFYRAIWMTP
jgi:hypothetical protein